MRTVLVTGANRGLGLEFTRQYAGDGWSVIAAVREPDQAGNLGSLPGNIKVEPLDMRDFEAVARFGERLGDAPLELLIANAGTWGPEQIERATDAEGWVEALRINTVGPVLLARTLLGNVAAARGKLIAITSKMGASTTMARAAMSPTDRRRPRSMRPGGRWRSTGRARMSLPPLSIPAGSRRAWAGGAHR